MKKIILSCILSCYVFASIADDVQNCKANNKGLDEIIECITQSLSDTSKYPNIIGVYSSTQDLPHNQSHKDFYDEVDIKFQEAMLEIRASAVAEHGLKIWSKSTKKVKDNSKNKEAVFKAAKEDAAMAEEVKENQKYKRIANVVIEEIKSNLGYYGLLSSLFQRVQTLIDPAVDPKNWTKEQKEQAKIEAQKALYSSNFTQEITKGSEFPKIIQSIVPLTTIITTNEQGKSELGVVAYMSERSIGLYEALRNHVRVPEPQNRSQCQSASDIVKAMDDEKKLTTLGLQYFYNENCQPALLGFGFSTYEKQTELEREYKNTAKSEAITQAQSNIAEFLGASTSTKETVTKQASAVQEALYDAMEDAIDKGELIVKNAEKKIAKSVAKEMKSIASGDTKGMKVIKNWVKDLGDYGVAGAVVYYSVDSIKSVDEMEKRINNANKSSIQLDIKSAASIKPSTRGSSNVVVDDF